MLSGDAAATLRSSGRRGRAQQVAAAAAAAAGAAPRGGSEHLPLLVRASRSAARRALLLALTLGLLSAASGSPGDQSLAFRRCHAQCIRTGCASLAPADEPSTQQQCSPLCGSGSSSGGDGAAPLELRLWRWDCAADCSYHCMWLVEGSRAAAAAAAGGGRQAAVWKYFGKWPFARWGGMQEPASVLFSLANLAAHAFCLRRFRRLCRGLGGGRGGTAGGAANGSSGGSGGGASPYAYAWLWQGYMLLSINAWLWSAAFHGRDTRLTERLDYFSAALLIFFNLFLCLARTLRLRSLAALAAAAVPLAGFLASHFRFMLFELFDYGYHMKVCIGAGIAQALMWVGWALAARPRHPGRRYLLAFVAAVHACMLLEVLDFPPLLHTLDAHSLWHAATAPLVLLFYRFIEADVLAHAPTAAGAKGAGTKAD